MEYEYDSSNDSNAYAKVPPPKFPSASGEVSKTSTATPTSAMADQNEADGTVTVRLNNYAFDEKLAIKELIHMIILHKHPLSIVDQRGFRKFITTLQPLFTIPSYDTLLGDILNLIKEEKLQTRRMIEMNESRIAITTDMQASDHRIKGNLVVTAHFIDGSWTLQKRILRCCYVPPPHTKEAVVEELLKTFSDYNNLDCKLSTITLDNCLVTDGVFDLLIDKITLDDAFFNIRCCAHVLNLIVKDGFDVIGEGIHRIHETVCFWAATHERRQKLHDSHRQLRVGAQCLFLDTGTGWQSTYLMIHRALYFKDAMRQAQLSEPPHKFFPTEEDWITAEVVIEKLEIFHTLDEEFSEMKHPTANYYFPRICEIKLALTRWICDPDVTISRMASRMMDKFEKYWNMVYGIMGVATLLDPRYKKYMLEYYFSKIYGPSWEVEVERIEKICRDFLREYEKKSTDTGVDIPGVDLDGYAEFLRKKKKSRKTKVGTELDNYLAEDVLTVSSDFDILEWWKLYGLKYPILQKIARDIYAVPLFNKTFASKPTFHSSLLLQYTDD